MKFQVLDINKTDIILLDTLTSKWLKYCIPENIAYEEIRTRDSLPIIFNIKYLCFFLYYFIKTRRLYLSSHLSIITIKNPKILMTFTDNSPLLGLINHFFPKLLNISIQNGTRYESVNMLSFTNIKKFPILYGFGRHEEKLLKKNDCLIREYNEAGSLKYGIYKKFNRNNYSKYNYITYISSWRGNLLTSLPIHFRFHYENQKKHFSTLISFCKENGFNFRICPTKIKTDSKFIEEIKYYNKLIPNASDIIFEKKEELDSYAICESSEIIITEFSTLGFEMLGVGKKVIFLAGTNQYLNSEPGWADNLNLLPKEIKIVNNYFEELTDKLKILKEMDTNEYLNLTKVSRNYYMNYDDVFVHQIIKQRINKYLYH